MAYLWYFNLKTLRTILNYAHQFIKITLVFHRTYLSTPNFYFIFETSKSLSVHSRSWKKIYWVENFRANVLKLIHQLIYVLSFMKHKDIKNSFFTFTSAFDGGYSDWLACSECSVTCGGGTQTFIRTCVPLNGVACSEPNEKTEPCNEQDCRKCIFNISCTSLLLLLQWILIINFHEIYFSLIQVVPLWEKSDVRCPRYDFWWSGF